MFIIQTSRKHHKMFYNGIDWSPGFPEMYGSIIRARQVWWQLRKRYTGIEIFDTIKKEVVSNISL